MYDYNREKIKIFTEKGQVEFLKVRDSVEEMLGLCGAFRSGELCRKVSGDTWFILACLDRLVELDEIMEIVRDCTGQDRVFTFSRKSDDERIYK